jgi:exopolyphosphatase/guanosine-5'-triphosphate,3'-diphosphate pyrophosphatase
MLAAADLGTNSFHLVVARALPNQRFEVLASEKEMVRLGSGSGDMKHLSADAIERGVAALRRFRQVADISDAPLRAVATSAVREAENQAEFLDRALRDAGVEVEVIAGTEEARLIHLGVLQALPVYDQRLLLVDIGGGSTELLVGQGPEVAWSRSLKLGAIRLTDRFFPDGRTNAKRADRCRRYLQSFLAPTARELREQGFRLAVGSSGTIQNLAVMAALLEGDTPPRSINSATFTRAELDKVTQLLLTATTPEERAKLPGIEARRADILPAGAVLLECLFDELGIDTMTVSTYALREGVLLDTLAKHQGEGADPLHHLSNLRRASVFHVLELFDPDVDHARHSTDLALQLFAQTRVCHQLAPEYADYLEAGGLLANVGRFISHESHHKHSYYLIRNSDQLTGFTSHEIELIAQVARYHRKSSPKPKAHPEFAALGPTDQRAVRVLAGLLRIGIGLDRGHARVVQQLRCDFDHEANELVIEALVDDPVAAGLEQYTADARKDLAEEALGLTVRVELATA